MPPRLWWRVGDSAEEATDTEVQDPASLPSPAAAARFALEAHLHEFLEENWDHAGFGSGWDLLEDEGEVVGSHYHTGVVGEIDLLARHKTEPRWLVVELKRDQTSDATVGQLLRYMSWVRQHMARPGESVEGVIVCRDADLKLRYAISGLPQVSCMSYEVSFQLRPSK